MLNMEAELSAATAEQQTLVTNMSDDDTLLKEMRSNADSVVRKYVDCDMVKSTSPFVKSPVSNTSHLTLLLLLHRHQMCILI